MSAVVTTGPELGSGALVADDDYPRHHAALAGGEPATPVPASWAERWYFNIQRPAGELVAVVGGAIYPGRGVAECYLCVLDGASQTNVRVWQPLAAPDPATPVDGPFRFSCTEPLERWEIAVASGTLALEAEFTATAAPYVYDPIDVPADVGDEATFDRWRHFVGVGRIAGTLGGAPIAADALSTRDRTWGIRSRRPRLHNWYVLHFAEGFLTLIHQERADGSVLFSEAAFSHAGGAVQRLTVVGHDLRFARDTRRLERGTVDLLADGGEPVTLRIEAAGRAISLAGAGYDARQGDRGAEGRESESWDLEQPEVARRTGRGTHDAPVTAQLGGAIDATGVGIAETAIARDHARYGASL